jgi:dienelactone hydrolase
LVKEKLNFSPSLVHTRLLRAITPALALDGRDLTAWQSKLRRKVRALLCMPKERSPLNPRTLWLRHTPLGTIEKVVFTSEPYSDVPAYVCLPAGVRPPYNYIICLQGHGTGMHNSIALSPDESQSIEPADELDFALWCMRHGLAALCIEMRGLGERLEHLQISEKNKGCPTAAMQGLALGRTLIGERIFDVDRGIDYLALRKDADMRRIGLMGHSSGGTAAIFASAVLKRLAFVIPVSYFCTFADSFMARRHCMCCYLPHIMEYAEMPDIAGLFAPKPFLAINGDADELFPMSATRRAFADLKKIYAAAGATGNCHLVVGSGGHRFFADAAWRKLDRILANI